MSNQVMPGTTLRIIRIALLSGVLLFGAVVAYLTQSGGLTPDPESAATLRLVFLPLALGTFAGILAVRTAQARAEKQRQGTFSIIGWALGEGVALFGGVAWMVAGEMLLYLTGLGLMILALLLVPIPADT